MLHYIQHAHVNNSNLEEIYLGLDFWVFDNSYRTRTGFEDYRLSRRNTTLRDIAIFNFSLFSLNDSLTTIAQSFQNPKIDLFYESDGFWDVKNKVQYLKANQNYDWNKYFFQWLDGEAESEKFSSSENIQENIKFFNDIVEYCKNHELELTVFIAPAHVFTTHERKIRGKENIYLDWKKAISNITPFWDFDVLNTVTAETASPHMMYFTDTSHFTPVVGMWIMEKITGQKSKDAPQDFGIWVDTNNIDAHLEASTEKYEIWKLNNPDEITRLEGKFE